MVRWIKSWGFVSAPVVVVFVPFKRTNDKFVFRFFFRIAIIRVIFSSSCSYCWTIEIWLIIFLATDKSGKLFRGTYYSTDVCFWSIRLVSILKHFLFPYCRFTTHFHHSNHAINRCWQCFFDYLECESFYQHHDKQLKLNLLDGQRCWDVRISVLVFTREFLAWNERTQSR